MNAAFNSTLCPHNVSYSLNLYSLQFVSAYRATNDPKFHYVR